MLDEQLGARAGPCAHVQPCVHDAVALSSREDVLTVARKTKGAANRDAVSECTRSRFFVTGPFARTAEWSSDALIAWAHAKEVGSAVTLCGLTTNSWVTLWNVPFKPGLHRRACPECRRRAR